MKVLTLLLFASLLAGCATAFKPGADNDGVLVSRLTQAQVREIAAARARENGLQVDASMPWSLSLSTAKRPYVWTAMLMEAGRPPPGYWLLIDDETGKADFVFPMITRLPEPPGGSDWLFKVREAMKHVKYPLRLEDFLRQVHATGIQSNSGGSTSDGRMYMEFPLRRESEGPARFELRCYIDTPEAWTEPKTVTGAELAYIDAGTNRYLLVEDARYPVFRSSGRKIAFFRGF